MSPGTENSMMKLEIPKCSTSPFGWWIASLLMRYENDGENISNPNRRCLAWENTILIKAADRDEAFKKAYSNGKMCESDEYDQIDTDSGKKENGYLKD